MNGDAIAEYGLFFVPLRDILNNSQYFCRSLFWIRCGDELFL